MKSDLGKHRKVKDQKREEVIAYFLSVSEMIPFPSKEALIKHLANTAVNYLELPEKHLNDNWYEK